ncbi:the peptidase M10A [Porites harrisoni]
MQLALLFLPLLITGTALGEAEWEEDEKYEEEDDSQFAENYLRQYHYLSNTRSENHDSTTAIKNFQKFFGLEQTGVLDDATLMQMRKPRCGVPDVDIGGERRKRYSTGSKWFKTDLKYYQEFGDDMSHADQMRIITRAFKYWSDVAPRLKFTRINNRGQADFWVIFGRKTHSGVQGERQCGSPFDGPGNVLAHAYFPPDGRIHFDDDERYSEFGSSSGFWWWKKHTWGLLWVAVHEIGHALGLHHSDVKGSVMWPTASKGTPKLHQDDMKGIRSLYGKFSITHLINLLDLEFCSNSSSAECY